jgi:sigma-B regulation protein RsbU (phosphoserine phosphatase)
MRLTHLSEVAMEQLTHNSRPLNAIRDAALGKQLQTRRQRLVAVDPGLQSPRLLQLLREVDAALERMQAGTFGICESCHDAIESDRLLLDPLCRNCLDHLSISERRALEQDLDLAFQVQRGLLPAAELAPVGWTMAYTYQPAGPVSGDYCDMIALEDGEGLFMIGDVTGKGVAASMLMAQLHAIFRSFISITRSVTDLVAKANRVFCQGNSACRFATLVCGRLCAGGIVEICNAGHCPPLLVSEGRVTQVDSTGLPVGLVADGEYPSRQFKMERGDSLMLYTDGLSEAFDADGKQYGFNRSSSLVARCNRLAPRDLLAAIFDDLHKFRAGCPPSDDLTIMVLRRER